MDILALILALTSGDISEEKAAQIVADFLEEHPEALDVQVATPIETRDYLGIYD